MKSFLLAMLWAGSAQAAELTVIKCTYIVGNDRGRILEMSGNLVLNDVGAESTTYLTLAPVQSIRVPNLEARILYTGQGYNPVTLHEPGQSASPVASAVLGPEGGRLIYSAPNGVFYSVICGLRK